MTTIELRFRYCVSLSGILKWLELLFSAIVLGLIIWEVVSTKNTNNHQVFGGEWFTCFVCFLTLLVVFLLLVVWFFNGPNNCCLSCRCNVIATFLYTVLVLLWIAAAGVEVWMCIALQKKENVDVHQYNRRPAAAAFAFINVVCCTVSLYLVKFRNL